MPRPTRVGGAVTAARAWQWPVVSLVDSCEVLRAPLLAKTDPRQNDAGTVRDWPNAVVTVLPCLYDSGTRTERRGPVSTVIQEQARFLVEPSADVVESDRIRYQGKTLGIAGVVPSGTTQVLKTVNVEETR